MRVYFTTKKFARLSLVIERSLTRVGRIQSRLIALSYLQRWFRSKIEKGTRTAKSRAAEKIRKHHECHGKKSAMPCLLEARKGPVCSVQISSNTNPTSFSTPLTLSPFLTPAPACPLHYLAPQELFKEQMLSSSPSENRLHAMKRLKLVGEALGTDQTVSTLIPYLQVSWCKCACSTAREL